MLDVLIATKLEKQKMNFKTNSYNQANFYVFYA